MKKLAYSILLMGLIALLAAPGCVEKRENVVMVAEVPVIDSTETADGLRIVYEVCGDGDPTVILVHCWSCNRDFWESTIDRFCSEYQVAAVDLAGHGSSGDERDSWTISDYAGDVLAVIEKLGASDVILVGHSMGAPVVLEAATMLEDQNLVGLVFIDMMTDFEMVPDRAQTAAFMTALKEDFMGTAEKFGEMMFAEGADTLVKNQVMGSWAKTQPDIAIASMENIYVYFEQGKHFEALKQIDAPIRAINATFYPTETETNQKYADYDAIIMDRVGHFMMLDQPEAFNDNLAEILAELTGVAGGMGEDDMESDEGH